MNAHSQSVAPLHLPAAPHAGEDPLLVPLLSVAQPLAECLGSDMAVLLPPLLPVLAAWAEKDPDLQVGFGV